MNNVDCSATTGWNSGNGFAPIGTFNGTLNGGNFNVSGVFIKINSTGANRGFFNGVANGVIKNFHLTNLNFTNPVGISNTNVGGLIGRMDYGSVINCSTTGIINLTGSVVGGLIGLLEGGLINTSYSIVNINATGGMLGGLIGNAGTMSGTTIQNTFAHGSVNCVGYAQYGAGGLIGYYPTQPVLSNSFSTGSVAVGSGAIGGFIGNAFSGSQVANSYWDINRSGLNTTSFNKGTGKTTPEMFNQNNYTGWDFVNVWEICPDPYVYYPHLKGQAGCLCVPNWVCSGYSDCLLNGTHTCNATTDLNQCGDAYTGNYSEFEVKQCIYPPENVSVCYQEQANTPTCVNQSAGGNFSAGSTYFNGNWSDWDGQLDQNRIATYIKPPHATNLSLWQISGYLGYGVYYLANLTLPPECWNRAMDMVLSTESLSSPFETRYGCYDENNTYHLIFTKSPLAQGYKVEEAMWWALGQAPPCVPNWNCSGYGNCLPNNTQLCNATTDLNQCGENYTGNFSEFTPQVCDFCVPSWFCSGWGDCLENNTQMCNDATDLNMCGEAYTGNYTELGGRECQNCVPEWVCDGYSTECGEDGYYPCNAVDDIYDCGQVYGGNYSEFQGQLCSYESHGYTPQYAVGDIPNLTLDTLGGFITTTTGYMGLIIIAILIGILLYALSRRK
jgi:hypothetical protein